MKEIINEPGNLILTEYRGIIDEVALNWGFKRGYFEKEKIPVLFIYSNFPHNISTNRQSLVGTIRTHVEEKKGIIFFPNAMKEEVENFIREASKKEKVEPDFRSYSGEKYEPTYLAQICETCFSIKNIDLLDVIMITSSAAVGESRVPRKSSIYHDIIEGFAKDEDKEVIALIIDKKEKNIIESLHLDQKPSTKRNENFQDLIKNKIFKSLFFDLIYGENSVPDRIKRFYDGKGWNFDSLLIFDSSRKKRVFIQDSPETALFLDASQTTFISLNTAYNLLKFDYESKPDQKITITRNKITERFDVLVDDKEIKEGIREIIMTFPGCINRVNQFLSTIAHNFLNEYRFYFDSMAIFVKIAGNKYIIESYEARQN